MGSVRQIRLANEWQLLLESCSLNGNTLGTPQQEMDDGGDTFFVLLRNTAGILWEGGQMRLAREHALRFHFPRFYPSIPMEGYLERPLFHPNVDPDTGFVCLWNRFSSAATIVEAVLRMQQVICWAALNPAPEHVMQPEALVWYRHSEKPWSLPLEAVPVAASVQYRMDRIATAERQPSARRRLIG